MSFMILGDISEMNLLTLTMRNPKLMDTPPQRC